MATKLNTANHLVGNHVKELILIDDSNAQSIGFFEFCRTHVFAGKNIIGAF